MVTLLSCLTLIPVIALSDLIKPPSTIITDAGSIAVTDSNGKARWTAEWTMEPQIEGGRSAVRFTEQGHGRYSKFQNEVRWSLEAVWRADRAFKPLKFQKTFTDSKGKTLSTETKIFDEAKGTMRFERRLIGEKTETKTLKIPPDTITVEGIAGVLQSLPFEGGESVSLHMLSNEPKVYKINIEFRGKERVRTSAGVFECYKVELVPRLGLMSFAKIFLGKTYFWFTVAPPHSFVRYEGYENGPGTPQIRMDRR